MHSIGGSPLLEPAYIAGDPPMIYRGNRGGYHPYNNVKTHGICAVLNPTRRVFIPSIIFFPIGNRHSIPHGVWCLVPPLLDWRWAYSIRKEH